MFTVEELKEKGAKRAVLEYITSEDPSIPIPEPVAEEDIGEGVIVRSDHWREFDSFEGIFDSVEVGRKVYNHSVEVIARLTDPQQILDVMHFRDIGNLEVDRKTEYMRNSFERYCKGMGLDPEQVMSEFRVFPQRKIDSRVRGTIFSHPNVPGRYIVYADGNGPQGDYNVSFTIDRKEGELTPLVGENVNGIIPLDMLLTVSPINPDDLTKIIQFYERVNSLPKFQDEFSYMMEFTFDPTYVLQMRRFRKTEDGSSLTCSWKDEKGVAATDLAFGVTEQQEGIVLPFLNAQMLIGIPQRWEGMNDEFFDLAAKHPQFAYRSSDDYHTKVIFPNAYAALGGNFCHSFHHGTLANMAHLPIYFSGMNHAIDSMNIPSETPVRLFSNGKEGYLKIEK